MTTPKEWLDRFNNLGLCGASDNDYCYPLCQFCGIKLIEAVQSEERERCARIAEQFTHKCPETGSCFEHHKAEVIARMIRANGSTEK